MRLEWVPSAPQAPFHVAIQRGWIAERGLDVEVEDGNGSVTAVQTVGAGKYDVGHANLSVMAMGHEESLPIRAVAGFTRKSDMGVLYPEGASIRTAKDLEGKYVVYTANSLETPFLDGFFRNAGINRDRMNLVAVDAAAKNSTYFSGRADAIITTVPATWARAQTMRPSSYLLFSDYGMPLPGYGLFATEATIAARPEMIRAFVDVAARGWEYERDHPEDAMDVLIAQRPQAGIDREAELAALKALSTFLDSERTRGKVIGWQSEEDWADALQAMVVAGVARGSSQPGDFYTNDFVPAR